MRILHPWSEDIFRTNDSVEDCEKILKPMVGYSICYSTVVLNFLLTLWTMTRLLN